jgi:hypothetical protein
VLTNEDAGGLIVTAESRALKRAVGSTAWAVLEDVVLDARLHEGRWLARTSVRLVAHHLDLTPGTAARALARLCSAGLVHREDRRDVDTGRFGESVYVVHLTAALRPCVHLPHTARRDTARRDTAAPHAALPRMEGRHTDPRPGTRQAPATARRRAADPVQLPLLGDEPPAGVPTPSIPSTQPKPLKPNPQTPTTHHPDQQPSSSTEPLNPTPQVSTDICQPSGRALPGPASLWLGAPGC